MGIIGGSSVLVAIIMQLGVLQMNPGMDQESLRWLDESTQEAQRASLVFGLSRIYPIFGIWYPGSSNCGLQHSIPIAILMALGWVQ